MAEPLRFSELRGTAILAAQEASGEVWTDYNVHDPGVTLLEAFAFAASEVAYRADFPIEDLLTGAQGRIDYAGLALAPPLEALPTRPVTARDLSAVLASAPAAIDGVIALPKRGEDAGLWDLYVIPGAGVSAREAMLLVARAFYRNRNLCEDIGTLAEAVPVRCRMSARIAVTTRHEPEIIAAKIYDTAAELMRDATALDPVASASRADATDDPARCFRQHLDPTRGARRSDVFVAALSRIEEVERVVSLDFSREDGEGPAFAPLPDGAYRTLRLPENGESAGLTLVRNGMELPFDIPSMRTEVSRRRTARRAARGGALDKAEWETLPQGRRRTFGHLPISRDLPPTYGVTEAGLPRAAGKAALAHASQLRAYLALSDTVLANADADLAWVDGFFAGTPPDRATYLPGSVELPDELAGGGGLDRGIAEAVRARDPHQDRRRRMLDHLLAFHCERHPQNSLRRFDLYRSGPERRTALLQNRARYLAEVAGLNRNRSAGPDIFAVESPRDVGMGRKLMLLLDFPEVGAARLADRIEAGGLRYDLDALPPRVARSRLLAPDDPFETFVPHRDVAPARHVRELEHMTPLLRRRSLPPSLFSRAALRSCYALSPEPGRRGRWRVFLTDGLAGDIIPCGTCRDREAAIVHANRLAGFFADLNRRSEGFYIIEHALVRGADDAFDPLTLSVFVTGWTARTQLDGFRQLFAETMRLVCPAHLTYRVHWLSSGDMDALEDLHLAWRIAARDADVMAVDGRKTVSLGPLADLAAFVARQEART